MFKKITLATAALALATTPALAGSPEPAPAEPVIASPAPVASTPDWTGFYAGAQLGYGNFDASPGGDEDEFIGGIVGGYDWDLGTWVAGVGADYDFAGGDVEQIGRLKARAGYKIGQGLLYGTAGYAYADADNFGDDDGYVIGAGYEHLISQNFSLGGEVLYHEFDNFDSTGVDVEATTVQLRGTFRF
ncbi:outer membrane beta-barrel protein [Roseovarius sp. CAU 1744]|uniref:outer membrane protein n=1 Tax=Roseovarius sp. CAU 1744 TaxID=3140368 RepID=UPI00325A742E